MTAKLSPSQLNVLRIARVNGHVENNPGVSINTIQSLVKRGLLAWVSYGRWELPAVPDLSSIKPAKKAAQPRKRTVKAPEPAKPEEIAALNHAPIEAEQSNISAAKTNPVDEMIAAAKAHNSAVLEARNGFKIGDVVDYVSYSRYGKYLGKETATIIDFSHSRVRIKIEGSVVHRSVKLENLERKAKTNSEGPVVEQPAPIEKPAKTEPAASVNELANILRRKCGLDDGSREAYKRAIANYKTVLLVDDLQHLWFNSEWCAYRGILWSMSRVSAEIDMWLQSQTAWMMCKLIAEVALNSKGATMDAAYAYIKSSDWQKRGESYCSARDKRNAKKAAKVAPKRVEEQKSVAIPSTERRTWDYPAKEQ